MRATALAGAQEKVGADQYCFGDCPLAAVRVGLQCVERVYAGLGPGSTVLDLEDFIVSNNLLPIGSLIYCLFCVTRCGWGYDSFLAECNTGKGLKLARWLRPYLAYALPAVILYIFIQGYIVKFFA